MKKRKGKSIKRKIQKKIELRTGSQFFETSKGINQQKKMGSADDRVNAKIQKSPSKEKISIDSVNDRDSVRFFGKAIKKIKKKIISYDIIDYGKYVKKENVYFDTVVYISSYNRYEKVKNILTQLFSQKTEYSFKILLMNDGSTRGNYNELKNDFPEIMYLENEINGGKKYYWRTKNKIWEEIKKIKTHAIIQIDDDFVLCENFIDYIMDLFFKLKEETNTYMGIRYHYGHRDLDFEFKEEFWDRDKYFHGFDGGSVFDPQFMEMFDYKIDKINEELFKNEGAHSYVWEKLNDFIIKFGVLVYKTKKSLAWHDGNEDSKMHPKIRLKRKVHTKNFLNDNERHNI